MIATRENVASFHDFAMAKLNNGGGRITFSELYKQWQAVREREEVVDAVKRSLADFEAGRYQPAREAMEEISQEFNLPPA